MLNNSGKNGHPCLVPDLRANAFSFSPLRIMFAVGLSYIAFIMLRFLLCLLFEVFTINGCWILLKAFSVSIEIIMWFLSFNLLVWCITLIDLHILRNLCTSGINLSWSWCMSFLKYCWILFTRILLRIFAFMLISDIGL